MPIPALPLFKHRETVVTPADQNQFVTQFETTMDTMSNDVIPAINLAITDINGKVITATTARDEAVSARNIAVAAKDEALTAVATLQEGAIDDTTIATNKAFSNSYIQENYYDKSQVDSAISNIQTLPIGAILNGYTIFDNCIVAFGGEFNRADYPKLWAYLQANPTLVKAQAQWQAESTANGGICGFFSSGNGTTTFRVPNLDKAFLRPDSRGVGSFEEGSYLAGDSNGSGAGATAVGMLNYDTNEPLFRSRMNWDSLVPPKMGSANLLSIAAGGSQFSYSSYPNIFGASRPKNIAVLPLIVAK